MLIALVDKAYAHKLGRLHRNCLYPALPASLGSGGDITEQAWAMLGKSVILLGAVFMSGRFTKAITSAI